MASTSSLYILRRHITPSALDEKKKHADANKLSDEIALLRITLEHLLNTTKEDEFSVITPQIVQLISTIGKSLDISARVSERDGNYVDASQLMAMCDKIIDLAKEYVAPKDAEAFANKIAEVMCPK